MNDISEAIQFYGVIYYLYCKKKESRSNLIKISRGDLNNYLNKNKILQGIEAKEINFPKILFRLHSDKEHFLTVKGIKKDSKNLLLYTIKGLDSFKKKITVQFSEDNENSFNWKCQELFGLSIDYKSDVFLRYIIDKELYNIVFDRELNIGIISNFKERLIANPNYENKKVIRQKEKMGKGDFIEYWESVYMVKDVLLMREKEGLIKINRRHDSIYSNKKNFLGERRSVFTLWESRDKISILDDFLKIKEIKVVKQQLKDLNDGKISKYQSIKKIKNTNNVEGNKQFPIKLNFRKQIIFIGDREFKRFNDFYELLRIKEKDSNKKSQKKGGVLLIYAISRYIEKNTRDINNQTILISDLLGYINEFKEKWDNWVFEKQSAKTDFSKTDCDTVSSIFGKCNINLRFKKKGKEEILITK